MATSLALGDYKGRRSVLTEHCNLLFEKVLLDGRWNGPETICVKSAKEMMKAISSANIYLSGNVGSSESDAAADNNHDKRHQTTPTSSSRTMSLKRSASIMMTNSTVDSSDYGHFSEYNEAAYSEGSSSSSSSSSSLTISLPKKNCSACGKANRAVAVWCGFCQAEFPTLSNCTACFEIPRYDGY